MIKAIETKYKGYRFRSRLEARWAVFFDALGLDWEYEPEGFDLGEAGWYLPDFKILLGDGQNPVWFEVKGKKATKTDIKKLEDLCEGTDMHGFIASGTMEVPTISQKKKGKAEITGAKIFHRWPSRAEICNIDDENDKTNLRNALNEIELNAICAFYESGEGDLDIDHVYINDTDKCPDLADMNFPILAKKKDGNPVDLIPFYKKLSSSGKVWLIDKVLESGKIETGVNTGSGRFYRSKRLKSAYQKARSARFEHGESP